MSYRKTKLIQERNILLERKYILEQAPPPTTGGTTTTPISSGTTSVEEKITEDAVKKAQSCSDLPNKIDETKNEKKTMKINGKDIIYFLGSKDKNVVYCSDYKKKMT